MRDALILAARGEGAVEPNPMVGAIVTDAAGAVVGRGFHERFGGPHAEVFALLQAGTRAVSGTLYVTLEPCCHTGKTPPCTDAVLRSGVRRVVVAMADPFPKVDGGGVAQLRAAGVVVEVGVEEDAARHLNAPYLKRLSRGQPWIHLKWAMTLDGKLSTRTGDSKWISSEASRAVVHQLRGRMDAILVGSGTVKADDPALTARPPGPRVPARIILTGSATLPAESQLRRTARDVPTIIFTTVGYEEKLRSWHADGVEVIGVPNTDTGLSLEAVFTELGKRQMTNVLVEGGAGLLSRCFAAGTADEVHTFIAPKMIGGDTALSPIGGVGIETIKGAWQLDDVRITPIGEDTYIRGRIRHESNPVRGE